MSSDDGYFDDELDSAFLDEVDAIEAAHASPSGLSNPINNSESTRRRPSPSPSVIEIEDSDPFDAFDFDVAVLQDIQEGRVRQHPGQPVAGPSKARAQRSISKGTIQTTLLGGIVPDVTHSKPKSSTKAPMRRTNSVQTTLIEKKTKRWDHTAFAKSGCKQSAEEKARKKGRGKASFDDAEDGEPPEFEQFPAPFVPIGPPKPMKLRPDLLAARQFIYPLNHEKRDYQFNIARHCLFENTLVALPTGLGKTFIAGVVMLNFFHWFPEGKVVFLAPTKPLVAQQIDASHKVCGIPGSHAAELTGEVSRTKRLYAYAEKRVLYMTPQTLMSDLKSQTCDPADIVLIVIDEAHKGTGDYAYAQIIRYMMSKNPHFRVLALTATPGSRPEAVQEIVDCLHISHIEIRNEESIDIRKYIHKKDVIMHNIQMDEDVVRLRDLLSKTMQPLIKSVQNNGAMHGPPDPVALHPFRCQSAMNELYARKAPGWALAAASKLQPLTRAMGYLLEASTNMCYGVLNSLLSGVDAETGKKAATRSSQNGLQKDPNFKALIKEVENQKNRGFSLHPKMEKLRTLLVQHFDDRGAGAGNAEESRVMVFVSYRECVDEVVEMLNKDSLVIRAARFVGQAADKQGRSGLAQRQQLEVIKQFKAGEFNVLVSTSIGEEGLDIGEVDVIVCYDAQKTPIRMLQRAGRTGRKRAGVVHVLLAQGREDKNWDKAKEKYQDIQDYIVKADELVFYGDAERLLPDHVKPECVERVMEIEEYVRDEKVPRKGSRADASSSPKGKKRKRDDDPARSIPAGASSGFVNVKDLLVRGARGKRQRRVEVDPEKYTGEDDDDDLEIEAGIFGSRRAASTSVVSRAKTRKPRRAKTIASLEGVQRSKKRRKKVDDVTELTESQIARMAADDSDDAAIERGLASPGSAFSPVRSPSSWSPYSPIQRTSKRVVSPSVLAERSIIDLTIPSQPTCTMSPAMSLSSSPDRPLLEVGNNVEDRRLEAVPLSGSSSPDLPLKSRSTSTSSRTRWTHRSINSPCLSSSTLHAVDNIQKDGDISWLIDDDDEPNIQVSQSSPVIHRGSSPVMLSDDGLDLFVDDVDPSSVMSKAMSSTSINSADGPVPRHRELMPPPALPVRLTRPGLSCDAEMMPEPTFAVRDPGKHSKKLAVVDINDSSPLAMPPPSQRRLHRQSDTPSPPSPPSPAPRKAKKRKFKDLTEAQKANPWIDVEATHSGDERSVGSSDAENEDGYESSFVHDVPETQVSPSYDQTAIYRRSLFTQAPGNGGSIPVFANRPAARSWSVFGRGGMSRVVSSSPRYEDGDDGYEFGSFVVDDDEDFSLAAHSSSEP